MEDMAKTVGLLFPLTVSRGKARQTWICMAPCYNHPSKALRYGTRSYGISQFYLHTPRSSANGMNHTCLCLLSRSWHSFTNAGGI